MSHGRLLEHARRWMPYYLMVLPAAVLLFLFSFLPLAGLVMAFQDYSPRLLYRSPWVGLEHFRTLLSSDPFFPRAFRNSLVLVSLKVPFGVLVPLALALLLREIRSQGFRSICQTTLLVPSFVSWVVASAITTALLSAAGPVNDILAGIGVLRVRVPFLTRADLFRPVLVMTDLWKSAGWYSLMFLSAMLAIDRSYYDAAAMDGAGTLWAIRGVTLPLIRPMTVTVTALVLITTLDTSFDQIINLYNPAVYETGDIIDTYLYRTGVVAGRIGDATAAGVVRSMINLVCLGAFLLVTRRRRAA